MLKTNISRKRGHGVNRNDLKKMMDEMDAQASQSQYNNSVILEAKTWQMATSSEDARLVAAFMYGHTKLGAEGCRVTVGKQLAALQAIRKGNAGASPYETEEKVHVGMVALTVDKKVEMNDWLEYVKGLMAPDAGEGVLLRKIVYMKMSRSPYGRSKERVTRKNVKSRTCI